MGPFFFNFTLCQTFLSLSLSLSSSLSFSLSLSRSVSFSLSLPLSSSHWRRICCSTLSHLRPHFYVSSQQDKFPIKSQNFKIVLEISYRSHFSYNFTLNNFSKACIPLK